MATQQELAAARAAADAKLAAIDAQRAKEEADAPAGATFGGSIVNGDQYGVTGGVHHGDVHPGHK